MATDPDSTLSALNAWYTEHSHKLKKAEMATFFEKELKKLMSKADPPITSTLALTSLKDIVKVMNRVPMAKKWKQVQKAARAQKKKDTPAKLTADQVRSFPPHTTLPTTHKVP